jgi:hypothetical protein
MEKEIIENSEKSQKNENGTTTIITLLIMMLLMGFVTFSLTRSANETIAVSNEISETKTLFAAQASIENMALKADAKFENKLTLTTQDITDIQNSKPANYDDYDFVQSVVKTRDAEIIDATGEQFQGLKAIRDEWQVTTNATEKQSGVKVSLRRRFFDNRIPIFQFGTFYEGDMNFFNPAPFNFGGRVHSNANIFIQSSTGLYFSSKVTAVGQILTNVAPNGNTMGTSFKENFIKDGSGTYQRLGLNDGSALSSPVNGSNLLSSYSLRPTAYRNSSWNTVKARFNNNLLNEQKRLNLPLKPKYENLIKRGLNLGDKFKNSAGNVVEVEDATKDGLIPIKERYYNKSGLRISLADSRDRLPGCATANNNCGIRLDQGTGYRPTAMNGGERSTRFNADRFKIPGRELWIKIEIVTKNNDTAPTTKEITEDILALGLTERSPSLGTNFALDSTEYTANADKYSIVKLQRFVIPGAAITSSKTYLQTFTNSSIVYNYVLGQEANPAPTSPLAPNVNPIESYINESQSAIGQTQDRFGCHGTQKATPTSSCNNYDSGDHRITATVSGVTGRKVVPFPIMMFDTREGMVFDGTAGSGKPTPSYPSGRIPWAGVMSAVDIDINNLRLFLDGDTTLLGLLPTTGTLFTNSFTPHRALSNTDVSQNQGWVIYISDRRGDHDFDGEYDMEDLLSSANDPSNVNDGVMTAGEDSNNNGTLETDYINEAPKYSEYVSADVAAVSNTRFFRRVVRLINGTTLPGNYDKNSPENTKGLTIASENGVYVIGNYNSTGVSSYGSPTPSTNYLPQGDSAVSTANPNPQKHIPAAIVADGITLLSKAWRDSYSFSSPFNNEGRDPAETTYRFGALVGKSKDWSPCVSGKNQGTDRGFDCQSGGVHNLLRYLEDWNQSDSDSSDDIKSNYSGSIINLFNSFNSNSVFKCCTTVYEPPVRNYVFENSFLDVNRIPPGSPFLQSITLTGFERIND